MTSKTVLSEVEGFTPLIDILIEQYGGVITAAVFGRVWRYCQGAYGECAASLQTIADELGLSYRTTLRHIKTLCTDGYLTDKTPKLRNRPHIYADTGKVGLQVLLRAGLPESQSALPESQSHYDLKSHEDTIRDKERDKKRELLQPAQKPHSPAPLPTDQSDWDEQDHTNFETVLESWVSEFGKLSTDEVAKMIGLWNEYPQLEIHEYAWNEMIDAKAKRGIRPNLAYYEKCLNTELRQNWTVTEGGNNHGKEDT